MKLITKTGKIFVKPAKPTIYYILADGKHPEILFWKSKITWYIEIDNTKEQKDFVEKYLTLKGVEFGISNTYEDQVLYNISNPSDIQII